MCKAGHKQTPPVVLHRAPGLYSAQHVEEFHSLQKCCNTQDFIINWYGFQRLSPNPQPFLVFWLGMVWFVFFFLQCTLCVNVAQSIYFANVSPVSVFEIVLKILLPFSQSPLHTEMTPHI